MGGGIGCNAGSDGASRSCWGASRRPPSRHPARREPSTWRHRPTRGSSTSSTARPTGSDASFDKWIFASSTIAASATQGRATLDPVEGAIKVGASPFGAYWYPVRPLGDAVIKLQYTVENTPESTRNGGIMIRSPEIRYTGATTADVLAQKPPGYNFDLCPGALVVCGRTTPAESTSYFWEGADGPFPPASDASDPPFLYAGAYCARNGTHNVSNLAGTGPLTTNSNANNHQHWTQVYCGHEIQINETLTGGGPQPSTDPIKTGSVYGFRNLNAKQSRTNERLTKGVWHDLEIRTIGQQYTVLIDGALINQFDNSVPKIASRNGDPPTMARQLARATSGLQTHGGNDRISYREIQVKDLDAGRHPGQRRAARGRRLGRVGQPLTCGTRRVARTPEAPTTGSRGTARTRSGRSTRASAPRASSTSGTSPPRPSPSSAPRT